MLAFAIDRFFCAANCRGTELDPRKLEMMELEAKLQAVKDSSGRARSPSRGDGHRGGSSQTDHGRLDGAEAVGGPLITHRAAIFSVVSAGDETTLFPVDDNGLSATEWFRADERPMPTRL
jgi:hypothetical protein